MIRNYQSRNYQSRARYHFSIENIVVSVGLQTGSLLDLPLIAGLFLDAQYNPTNFPGIVIYESNPVVTIMLFQERKMVITGRLRSHQLTEIIQKYVSRLQEIIPDITASPIHIDNLVGKGDLHCLIDLDRASVVMANTIFDPEIFPALIYRMRDPASVWFLFRNGCVICTEAGSYQLAQIAAEKIYHYIRACGVVCETGERPTF